MESSRIRSAIPASPRAVAMVAAAVCLAGIALSGCATNQGYLSPSTGVALEEAYNKQIIDPTPAAGPPIISPEKAQAAIERYLADEVKTPSPDADQFIIVE